MYQHLPVSDPQEIKLPLLTVPFHFRKAEDMPTLLAETNRKIKEADGIVLVSPENNRAAPPAITNFIDHFPPTSYKCKPTGVVTYSTGEWTTFSKMSIFTVVVRVI